MSQSAHPPAGVTSALPNSQWILNRLPDLVLFVLTPIMIVPVVWLLTSRGLDHLSVDIISTLVAAFGAMGHHFPGMIRAYCDRELFQRFRWRFIFAPLILLVSCIYFSQQHLNAMLLVLAVWGYWHGMMQVYGFARIYDAKAGSTAAITAYWDWLVCLFGFGLAVLYSQGQLARVLQSWYSSGGPLFHPEQIVLARKLCLVAMAVVLVGFGINYIVQTRRGSRQSPVKLLILASGIGFWWYCMVGIENLVLGITMFEVFHDVQYLAIVWLFNRRRVEVNSRVGNVLRYLFRGNVKMILLYLGLIFAYGTIALVASVFAVHERTKTTLMGIVWASTILHFYFDGFIWKVREESTRAGLGLVNAQRATVRAHPLRAMNSLHLLKWLPLVGLVCWLAIQELSGSVLSSSEKVERLWPDESYRAMHLNLAEALPGDLHSQRQAAVTLANQGEHSEAIARLTEILREHPEDSQTHRLLGEVYLRLGRFDESLNSLKSAAASARSDSDRVSAGFRLGQLYVLRKNPAAAEREFRDALQPGRR